jgi:hypothetical protein
MKEEESQNRNSDAAAFKIGPGKPREPVPFMIQILLITGIRYSAVKTESVILMSTPKYITRNMRIRNDIPYRNVRNLILSKIIIVYRMLVRYTTLSLHVVFFS